MKRRILSLIMVLVMTVGFLPAPASAATYLDTRGNWAEEAIDRWSGYGVIQGNNGKFNPAGNLTRAHMAAILSRLLQLPEAASAGFKDVKPGAWYEDAINRCAAAGIMLGDDGYANPGASITRQQAVVMLARALKIAPIANPDLSGYTDAANVSSYAIGYIAAMAEAGIVRGTSDTTISPYANITRAATVTILHRAIDVYANVPGATVDAEGDGLVLVVADNVTVNAPVGTSVVIPSHISSATVNGKVVAGGQAYEAAAKQPTGSSGGSSYVPSVPSVPSTPAAEDLTITESSDIEGGTYRNVTITEAVGNGEVSFTDVTITGNLTILGGGSNTIRMNGCNVHGKVKIDKDSSNNGSQPPRLHLTDTPVPQVEATKPAIIEAGDSSSPVGTLTASDNVTIQGANTKVETVSVPNVSNTPIVTVAEGAQIETVAVAPDATAAVEVNAGASVATVDAKGETIIDAVGTVETVSAAASVTVESGSVDKVEVPAGKSAEVTVSENAAVTSVEAKGNTTIKADGANVSSVTAAASVTIASGKIEKVEIPANMTAEVTVAASASVISVDAEGTTTINANGANVSSVTASANVTVASGTVGRVEIPDDTTEAVSVTVSESASVSDVTVNTTNNVEIDAQGENSVGTVSTDKDNTNDLKVTVVGNGNKGQQPSSHNWPTTWTPVDNTSHKRVCTGHPNHPHTQIDVHSWNAGEVTKQPTCTDAGEMTYTCSLCGGTKETSIAPNGHTIVVDAYQKPTCTQPGMTEGKHCSACNTVLVEQTTIAATGHIWSSDTDPDCNSCGATREVMSEELNQLIAEAEELGLLKYLDKSTLFAGAKVSRLQLSMLTGAFMTDINFTSPLYGADIYDSPAWNFSDGADLTAQQKSVIMTLCSNGLFAGYADGTFRPDATVTRGAGTKVLAYALLEQQKADALIATYTVFNDVTDTVALAPYIEWAAVQGLVSGDRSGNFRPYDSLTIEDALRWFIITARSFDTELFQPIAQAEALGLLKYVDENSLFVSSKASRLQISMLLGALLNVDTSEAFAWGFNDGKDLTALQKSVIMVLNQNGYIGGYPDQTFRPNDILTRGAGTKVIAYACLGQEKADKLTATYTVFNDVDSSVALAPYIEWAANNGIVSGDRNGNFRPYDALTVKDALRLFIKIASLDGSYGVTNIRFEDQHIKWDQPTAVVGGMNVFYEVSIFGSNNLRSNCGTNRLSVANYAFPKGEYQRIEIATYVDDIEMAVVQAAIDLTISESTSAATPTAAFTPITDESSNLIGYTVSLTGLTPRASHTVHLTNGNVEWGWDSANFQEAVSDADGKLSLNFHGRDAIEFATNGYLFVFEQTANNVISKTEAVTSVATVIKPDVADYPVRNIRMNDVFIEWDIPSNCPGDDLRYELSLSEDGGNSWNFSTTTGNNRFFGVYLPAGNYNAIRIRTLYNRQPVGEAVEYLNLTIDVTAGSAADVYFAPNGNMYSMLIGDLSSETPIDIALSDQASFNSDWCSFGSHSNGAGIAVRDDLENSHKDLNDLLSNGYYYLVEFDCDNSGNATTIHVTERGGWIKATLSGSLPAEYAVSNIRITLDGYLRWDAPLNAEELRYRIHLNDGNSWNEDGGTNSNLFPLMAFCWDRDDTNPGDMDTMTYYNVRIETFDSANVSRATKDAADLMLTVNTVYSSSIPTATLDQHTDGNNRTYYVATVSGLTAGKLYLMRARVADGSSYRGDFVSAIADSNGVARFVLRSDDAANIVQNGEYKIIELDQIDSTGSTAFVCTVSSPCDWTKFTLNP